jgi:hypothetical protein
MNISVKEKRKLDDWYNSLPNRLKENVPHWRESTYIGRMRIFLNPTEGFIEVSKILADKKPIPEVSEYGYLMAIQESVYRYRLVEVSGYHPNVQTKIIATDLDADVLEVVYDHNKEYLKTK